MTNTVMETITNRNKFIEAPIQWCNSCNRWKSERANRIERKARCLQLDTCKK